MMTDRYCIENCCPGAFYLKRFLKYWRRVTFCVFQSVLLKLVTIAMFSCCTLAILGWAQELGAGDAAHFLREGIGARARALGGAYVALATDTTATYWNPAGLVQTPSMRLGGTYESRYGGLVEFQCLSGAISWHSFSAGLLWVASDMYSVFFGAVGTGFGDFSLGLTGKLYNFASGLQTAHGMGLDFGILWRTPIGEAELAIGLISADIGWSTIHWQGAGWNMVDHVAWVNRLGVALSSEGLFGPWLWAADLEVAFRRPPRPGETDYFSKALQISLDLGAEFWFQFVTLRGGLADISVNGANGVSLRPTLGVGVRWAGVVLDAAWTTFTIGHTYLLSMEFTF